MCDVDAPVYCILLSVEETFETIFDIDTYTRGVSMLFPEYADCDIHVLEKKSDGALLEFYMKMFAYTFSEIFYFVKQKVSVFGKILDIYPRKNFSGILYLRKNLKLGKFFFCEEIEMSLLLWLNYGNTLSSFPLDLGICNFAAIIFFWKKVEYLIMC